MDIRLGEEPDEPQFCVTDLLPHLGAEQMNKTLSKAIEGENLNILIGSRPIRADKGSNLFKLNIMKLIHEKYDIVEEDFVSAEIEFVPAFPARDVGFDKSMIGGLAMTTVFAHILPLKLPFTAKRQNKPY
ncbi:MAG: hypothetical protein ACLSCV_01435 [Acutalibacteraceae bacterium]